MKKNIFSALFGILVSTFLFHGSPAADPVDGWASNWTTEPGTTSDRPAIHSYWPDQPIQYPKTRTEWPLR